MGGGESTVSPVGVSLGAGRPAESPSTDVWQTWSEHWASSCPGKGEGGWAMATGGAGGDPGDEDAGECLLSKQGERHLRTQLCHNQPSARPVQIVHHYHATTDATEGEERVGEWLLSQGKQG